MKTNMNPHKSRFFNLLLALALALVPAFSLSQPVQAETIACVVTSDADSGDGTLRALLADPACSTITFDGDYTIRPVTELVLSHGVTIDGAGHNVTISGDTNGDGSGETRIFGIGALVTASINHLTLEKGDASYEYNSQGGSAVLNYGTLTMTNSHVTGNTGQPALSNYGTLTVAGSFITGNTGESAIDNYGILTVRGSDFSDNQAVASGAAIASTCLYHSHDSCGPEYAKLTVDNSRFINNTATDNSGGAIRSTDLTLTDSTFEGNTATYNGGAIAAWGSLSVAGSTFSGNQAQAGGAILNQGSSVISDSTFSGNSGEYGGAIYNFDSDTLLLTNSTFSGNTASYLGGGIMNEGALTVTNSTFVGNITPSSSAADGSAIFNSGILVLTNSTMILNRAYFRSATISSYDSDGATAVKNTLFFANNGLDCRFGTGSHSGSHNISSALHYSTMCDDTAHYMNGADLVLGPLGGQLGDYGGRTQTVALRPGSPAIDAGDDSVCPLTDQRGVSRPQGGGCDVGAFESQGFTLTKTGDNQSTFINTAFAEPLAVSVTANGAGEPVDGGRVTFAAPASGASAVLTGWGDVSGSMVWASVYPGMASVSAQANDTAGSYTVTASARGATDASFALTQDVFTISPATLPDGTYRTAYSQQLTASGGSGSYTFSTMDTLPENLTLYADGRLEGLPLETGAFAFTVNVVDNNDPSLTASQPYTLVIAMATPTVTVTSAPDPSTLGRSFVIKASAGLGTIYPSGTFAFYVDDADIPIPGCEAVPMGTPNASCSGGADIAAGEHTLKVVYIPGNYWNPDVNSATGTTTHTVGYQIAGTLFNDTNNNGIWDTGESSNDDWLAVRLDKDCDGVMDYDDSDWRPEIFQFLNLLPGTYCLSVNSYNYYIQTSYNDPITLNANQTLEVGLFRPEFVFSPEFLPDGNKDVPYSSTQITVSGGTAPYTITMDADVSRLPEGMTFDEGTATLSGTPTEAGQFLLSLSAQDATMVTEFKDYEFYVRTDGTFTLTSSANPSAPGDPVTFTLSGTGDVVMPSYGLLPPVGHVTFYDDGVAIPGCSEILLNFDPVNGPGDYPAACTTSTLTEGSHVITAVYTDWPRLYNDTTLTLTQQVEIADDSAPEISYTVNGVFPAAPDGTNDWYVTDAFVDWTVTDPESAVTIDEGCVDTTINFDTAGVTLTCKATSAGGSSEPVTVTIKRDATAPINVSGAPYRDPDSGTWYNHLVDVNFTATDATSGVARCSSVPYSGPDGAGRTVNGTCTDNAGNTAAPVASSVFDYDATAPINVSGAPGRAPDSGTWYNHAVDVLFTAADATSGVARCSSVPYSGPDGAGRTVTGRCTDNAGNTSAAVVSSAFDYDATAPIVAVTGVSEGETFILGAVPEAGCSTNDETSGEATNAAISITGGNSLGVGNFTATCSGAQDNAGNAGNTADVHYNVTFLFTGFSAPVDNNGVLNIAKAGQPIPLKFRIADANGNPITNLTSVTVTVESLACSAGTTTDLIEEYAAGNSGLQNLGDGYYQWNWRTPKTYASSCKTLKLDLGEGIFHIALFQFKK